MNYYCYGRKKVYICGMRISKITSTYEHYYSLPSTIGLLQVTYLGTQSRDIGPAPTVYIK
jgi:hypothetical protein